MCYRWHYHWIGSSALNAFATADKAGASTKGSGGGFLIGNIKYFESVCGRHLWIHDLHNVMTNGDSTVATRNLNICTFGTRWETKYSSMTYWREIKCLTMIHFFGTKLRSSKIRCYYYGSTLRFYTSCSLHCAFNWSIVVDEISSKIYAVIYYKSQKIRC